MKRLLLPLAVGWLAFVFAGTSTVFMRFLAKPNRPQVTRTFAFDFVSIRPASFKQLMPEDVAVEGRYSNFEYGYSVRLPAGMIAARNPDPTPNHGFGIDLTCPSSTAWINQNGWPKAYLSVDGSYNAALYGSINDEISCSLRWLKEKHKGVQMLSKTVTRLGSLRATSFVVEYDQDKERMVEERVVALRKDSRTQTEVIYTIHLATTLSRYNQDRRALMELQRTWLIDPLPGDAALPAVYEKND